MPCPVQVRGAQCGVPLQRTSGGRLADGVNEHLRVLHPEMWKQGWRCQPDGTIRMEQG
jgi:hypothetical protein